MKEITVGIVTFHTADNYGAVLQAYALQTYIRETFGYKVNIIDLNTPELEKEHTIFKRYGQGLIRDVLYNLVSLCNYFTLRKKIKRFADFRKDELCLTHHKYSSEEDFLTNMEQFDYYITGSDQVFNPYFKYYKCCYLGFNKHKGKKIAYAPSFGISDFSDKLTNQIEHFLSDFDALSCREKNGADYLSKITNREVLQVCDPVFLLKKEEWEKIAVSAQEKRPYIFVYDLNGGKKLIDIAKKISKQEGDIRIICATSKSKNIYPGVKVLKDLGPKEFLGYIMNSAFVVTDSFHGTSFSYIFEKKCISYIALKGASSRIYSLADSLGTREQVITDVDSLDNNIVFQSYKEKLIKFSESSKNYLEAIMK